MVLNNIEKLLEKYEKGETSIKEERVLKTYFSSNTVAPHLEMYKPLFGYFIINKEEQFIKDLPLKTKRTLNYKWLSIAAVAVVMLSVYLGESFNNNDLGTYQDPKLAFTEFSKSMEKISESFNKGTSVVGYLNEVNRGTATLGYLSEIEQAKDIIFKK